MRLVALTVAASAIRVVGVVETGEPLIMARAGTELLRRQNKHYCSKWTRNIFQWEMSQAHYVNPKSI